MTIAEDLEQTGLNAVDYFLETWNSRNPERWADSLNFPHVRPSPIGPVRVAKTVTDYISGVNFQRTIDTGWDHSEWDYRSVLQVSPRKIHVAGQWSRYNRDGKVILTTPIVYIVTDDEGHWGIQSRFGSDYAGEDMDTTELMSRGLALVQDFVNQHNTRNQAACAEMLNYPHFTIGIGELAITEEPHDLLLNDTTMKIESLQAIQTGRHSINVAVDLELAGSQSNRRLQGVVHVNDRNNHLGIQAWSLLEPDTVNA